MHTSALQQAEETWVSQDRHVFLPSKWVEVKAWLQGKDGDACSVMHECVSRDIFLQKDFIAHILSSPLCLPGTTGESVGVTSGAGTETTSGAPLTGVTSGNPAGKTEGQLGLCCGLTLAVARTEYDNESKQSGQGPHCRNEWQECNDEVNAFGRLLWLSL